MSRGLSLASANEHVLIYDSSKEARRKHKHTHTLPRACKGCVHDQVHEVAASVSCCEHKPELAPSLDLKVEGHSSAYGTSGVHHEHAGVTRVYMSVKSNQQGSTKRELQ